MSVCLSVRWQKMALLVLLRVGLCVGQNQMCHLCGGNKIELKKCAVGKIKNTEGSAMSVGLLVVFLQYGLYVVHLSKWFVFAKSLKFLSVCCRLYGRPTIGYNVLRLGEGGDFTTELSYEAHTSNLRKTVIRSTEPPLLPSRCVCHEWQTPL